eukprot:3810622-Amphidinium_carterae.1
MECRIVLGHVALKQATRKNDLPARLLLVMHGTHDVGLHEIRAQTGGVVERSFVCLAWGTHAVQEGCKTE